MKSRGRTLGVYLLLVSAAQVYLYLMLTIDADKFGWLFYFDPRIGIFFLETVLRGAEPIVPGFVRWLSAMWIFVIGMNMLKGRLLVTAYIISEIILVLPNVGFFCFIAALDLGPSHGFSVGELTVPMLVTLVFSIVPLILAFMLRRRIRASRTSEIARA